MTPRRRTPQVYRVGALNVAGPRESESPGVYAAARVLLRSLLAGSPSSGL